jgi:hypothetical protein
LRTSSKSNPVAFAVPYRSAGAGAAGAPAGTALWMLSSVGMPFLSPLLPERIRPLIDSPVGFRRAPASAFRRFPHAARDLVPRNGVAERRGIDAVASLAAANARTRSAKAWPVDGRTNPRSGGTACDRERDRAAFPE